MQTQSQYQKLASTEPAQSPVAGSSFATGLTPGGHGIFNFLHRDARHFDTVGFLGMTLPLGVARLDRGRSGTSFRTTPEQSGQRAGVMRVPVTFPPEPVQQMISGMGVPNLPDTQGSYTLIANHLVPAAESGGRVVLQAAGEDGDISTSIPGPAHALYPSDAMALPIRIIRTLEPAHVEVELDGLRTQLSAGEWSEWIQIGYRFLGIGRIPGMVRLRLISGFPKLRLYVSPAQVDPLDPAFRISSPEHAATALGEGEAMLYDILDRGDSALMIKVLVQRDRVCHLYWRGLDTEHPLHAQSSPLARDEFAWIYRESDRVLGEIQGRPARLTLSTVRQGQASTQASDPAAAIRLPIATNGVRI